MIFIKFGDFWQDTYSDTYNSTNLEYFLMQLTAKMIKHLSNIFISHIPLYK